MKPAVLLLASVLLLTAGFAAAGSGANAASPLAGNYIITFKDGVTDVPAIAGEWSLGLDLKILLMTAAKVVRRSGISREGHVTMPEFMGSDAGREERK